MTEDDFQRIIQELKNQGRQKEIETIITQIKKENASNIPIDLAYCSDELFDDYIHDMKLVIEVIDFMKDK